MGEIVMHFKDRPAVKKAIKTARALSRIIGAEKAAQSIYRHIIIALRDKKTMRDLDRLLCKTGHFEKVETLKGRKLLHYYPAAFNEYPLYFNAFIDKALKLRGAEVDILLCMGGMKFCTTSADINDGIKQYWCDRCRKFGPGFMKRLGLNFLTYRDFISQEQIDAHNESIKSITKIDKERTYKGVNVGFQAWISAERYFLGYVATEQEMLKIYALEMANALITVDVAEAVLKRTRYDAMWMQHGMYSSWGSFIEYFKKSLIPSRVIDFSSYHDNKICFDGYLNEDNYEKYLKARNHAGLNEEEAKELDDFLYKRFNFISGNTDIAQFEYPDKLPGDFITSLKKYKKVVAIFTNIQWEGGLIGANICFKDIYSWVDHTIEVIRERPDIKLIIKPHPWDQYSRESVDEYIRRTYPDLPENITVFSPRIDIKAYDLIRHIDCGVVCTGTLGIEMTLNGVPAITVGRGHYRGKGFTYDASTKEEYAQMLTGGKLEVSPDMRQKARQYSHYYFVKTFIAFPLIGKFSFYNDFLVEDLHSIEAGKSREMDHICDFLGGKKPVFQDW